MPRYPEVANSEEFIAKHKAEKAKAESSLQLTPYQYMWGGQLRDKRSNSMTARPFYR